MTHKSLAVIVAVGLTVAAVAAQQQEIRLPQGGAETVRPPDPNVPLYFEVASVKQNKTGEMAQYIRRQPGGRMNATNMPARQLISFAYQLTPFTLVGGPGWLTTDRFDIVAKLEGDPPPIPPNLGPDHMQLALRTLLADRFKLKVHRETRELDVYALVQAKPATFGPKLKPTTFDCSPEAMRAAIGRGGPPPGPPAANELPRCGLMIGPGRLRMGGLTMSTLAGPVGNLSGRIVVDRTGLTGGWDLELMFAATGPVGPPGPNGPPPADPDAPSIFAALTEQAGLKLEATKAPIEVVVIDSVEQPTPD